MIDGVSWQQRTSNLRDRLRGIGPEVIGPGDMKGHDTHLHLAAKGGMFNLNQAQYDYFYGNNAGGTQATFHRAAPPVVPTTSVTSTAKPTDRENAVAAATDYSKMSKGEINTAYDALRNDPAKAATAADEGMKMHKAFFKYR